MADEKSREDLSAFIGDRAALGGVIAQDGFFYQNLYAIRLIQRVVSGEIDDYACEALEDFLAWKRAPDGSIETIELIAVKHAGPDGKQKAKSPIQNSQTRIQVLQGFIRTISKIRKTPDLKHARIICRFIYNPIGSIQEATQRTIDAQIESSGILNLKIEREDIRYEPFLTVPISPDELSKEFEWITERPHWKPFLSEAGLVITLAGALVAACFPFHSSRLFGENPKSRRGRYPITLIQKRKAPNAAKIHQLIESCLATAHSDVTRSEQDKNLVKALERAKTRLLDIPVREEVPAFSVSARSHQEAISIITLLELAKNESALFGFNKNGYTISKARDGSITIKPIGNTLSPAPETPIPNPLNSDDFSHKERVMLFAYILSELRNLSAAGIRMHRMPEFTFYSTSGNPINLRNDGIRLILKGGFQCFEVVNHKASFSAVWQPAGLIADLLRGLFLIPRQQSAYCPFKKAYWIDRTVPLFANWIEKRSVIHIDELISQSNDIFRDSLECYPLATWKFSSKAIWDALEGGWSSLSHALQEVKPTHVNCDISGAKESAYYFLGESTALVCSLGKMDFGVHRILRRDLHWQRKRDQDTETAIPLCLPFGYSGLSVFLASNEGQVDQILKQVYGVEPIQYSNWLHQILEDAEKDSLRILEGSGRLLRRELTDLSRRRKLLSALEDIDWEFEVDRIEDGRVSIAIFGETDIRVHLEGLGYLESDFDCLSVEVTTAHRPQIIGTIANIDESNINSQKISITLSEDIELEGTTGICLLRDLGNENVIRRDEALFRKLQHGWRESPLNGESISVSVWKWLERLVGEVRDEANAEKPVHKRESIASDENTIYDWLSREGRKPLWISGGAGTGKTTLVAKLIGEYIEGVATIRRRPKQISSGRVLVVAMTHFALDNFASTFRNLFGNKYIVNRFVTKRQRQNPGEKKKVNEDVLQWSSETVHSVRLARFPLNLQSVSSDAPSMGYRRRLLTKRAEVESAKVQIKVSGSPVFIASHQGWIAEHLGHADYVSEFELETRAREIQDRLDRLDQGFTPADTASFDDDTEERGDNDRDRYFASNVIICTVDSFPAIPRMNFDLILFEEASQLTATSIFKTLLGVQESRRQLGFPDLIFSGDAKQLPPYIQTLESDPIVKCMPRECVFEEIGRNHNIEKQHLTMQFRMPEPICSFVGRLFYGELDWRSERSDAGMLEFRQSGDHDRDGKHRQLGTYSYWNPVEANEVESLVGLLLERGENDILVISPYKAQVKCLQERLPDRVQVKTIDACQGIESKNVIVTFVSFEKGSDFVYNRNRMNVALSRSSHSLFLIGNFARLKGWGRDLIQRFPHIETLLEYYEQFEVPCEIESKPFQSDKEGSESIFSGFKRLTIAIDNQTVHRRDRLLHRDVITRSSDLIRQGRLRWVCLADPVVSCTFERKEAEIGTWKPNIRAFLDLLRESGDTVSVRSFCEYIGVSAETEVRVVFEYLHHFEAAGFIRVDFNLGNGPTIRVVDDSIFSDAVATESFFDECEFHPISERFATQFRKTSLKSLRMRGFPVYANRRFVEEFLASANFSSRVEDCYQESRGGWSMGPRHDIETIGNEHLQLAAMMTPRERPMISASLVGKEILSRRYVIHKCYLFRTGRSTMDWEFDVREYPSDRGNRSYSQFLMSLPPDDRDEIFRKSQKVSLDLLGEAGNSRDPETLNRRREGSGDIS